MGEERSDDLARAVEEDERTAYEDHTRDMIDEKRLDQLLLKQSIEAKQVHDAKHAMTLNNPHLYEDHQLQQDRQQYWARVNIACAVIRNMGVIATVSDGLHVADRMSNWLKQFE